MRGYIHPRRFCIQNTNSLTHRQISFIKILLLYCTVDNCLIKDHVMWKPVYAKCEQQRRRSACASAHPRSLISAFGVRCLDSVLHSVSISEQASTQKTGFLVTRLLLFCSFISDVNDVKAARKQLKQFLELVAWIFWLITPVFTQNVLLFNKQRPRTWWSHNA